jgi:hypothetical protein
MSTYVVSEHARGRIVGQGRHRDPAQRRNQIAWSVAVGAMLVTLVLFTAGLLQLGVSELTPAVGLIFLAGASFAVMVGASQRCGIR